MGEYSLSMTHKKRYLNMAKYQVPPLVCFVPQMHVVLCDNQISMLLCM
jgi:hypothetical protein